MKEIESTITVGSAKPVTESRPPHAINGELHIKHVAKGSLGRTVSRYQFSPWTRPLELPHANEALCSSMGPMCLHMEHPVPPTFVSAPFFPHLSMVGRPRHHCCLRHARPCSSYAPALGSGEAVTTPSSLCCRKPVRKRSSESGGRMR